MPLDPSYVGHVYPPTPPYLVSAEKIREFADAIGALDPAYRDPDAAKAWGHPDVIAPPTFPIAITAAGTQLLIDDPGLGLDFSRVVHGGQRFRYERPVRAGDQLCGTVTIEEISTRGPLSFLTTRTEVATRDGEPVVTAWMKLVVRGE